MTSKPSLEGSTMKFVKKAKQRLKKFNLLSALYIIIVSLHSVNVSADPFPYFKTFSNTYINDELANQFPIEKYYEEIVVTFSDPEVVILPLDNKIEINVKITALMNKVVMKGKGVLIGNVQYFTINDTIILKRPLLERVFSESDEFTKALPLQKVIKQTMSHQFRDLDLINLVPYAFKAENSAPNEITIAHDKVIVHWN